MQPSAWIAAAVPAYLAGAVPFGYLVARARGVDIFAHGSGNIGATNVGRVLGAKLGLAVFALDFLKGAVPAGVGSALAGDAGGVAAGLAAFLGHLFPVYLGFRGGKGVATGAGVVAVLLPGPFAVSLLTWLAVVAAGRTVSLASVCAAAALAAARVVAGGSTILTGFALVAALLVVLRHAGNVRRLLRGTEPATLPDTPLMHTLARTLHVLALAAWFGSALAFTFGAVVVFDSFKQVVRSEPGPRTANVAVAASVAGDEERLTQLANALAGAAVGPLFGPFFALQAVCGVVALATALGWWRSPGRRVDRARVVLLALAVACVAAGWPLARYVGELRELRYAADAAAASAARQAFGPWHTASLLLNFATFGLALAATALAGQLPGERPRDAATA